MGASNGPNQTRKIYAPESTHPTDFAALPARAVSSALRTPLQHLKSFADFGTFSVSWRQIGGSESVLDLGHVGRYVHGNPGIGAFGDADMVAIFEPAKLLEGL
jgi:hypothetical protein